MCIIFEALSKIYHLEIFSRIEIIDLKTNADNPRLVVKM